MNSILKTHISILCIVFDLCGQADVFGLYKVISVQWPSLGDLLLFKSQRALRDAGCGFFEREVFEGPSRKGKPPRRNPKEGRGIAVPLATGLYSPEGARRSMGAVPGTAETQDVNSICIRKSNSYQLHH